MTDSLDDLEAEFGARLAAMFDAAVAHRADAAEVAGGRIVRMRPAPMARPSARPGVRVLVTVAAGFVLVVAGLVWLGRSDRALAPTASQPGPAPTVAPPATVPDGLEFVPARWRDAVAWIDRAAAALSTDNVLFGLPSSQGELALEFDVRTVATDAAVQQCLNGSGFVDVRAPAATRAAGAADWDAYLAAHVVTSDPSSEFDAARAACLESAVRSRLVTVGTPDGGQLPELDAGAHLDDAGRAAVAAAVTCAAQYGSLSEDPLSAPGAALAEASRVAFAAGTATSVPGGDSERGQALCPQLADASDALGRAAQAAERVWLDAHPDVAGALVDAHRHNMGVFREILANDLEYIGSVELDGDYIGVALRDQGAGMCLMVDAFYDSGGCDTVAAPFGPFTVRTAGDLVYGVFVADTDMTLNIEGENSATSGPVPYGTGRLRMLASRVPPGGSVTVSATLPDGTVVASETFES